MTHDLRPYPEYKDSGLPWLGRVPKQWQLRRAKYLLCELDQRWKENTGTLLSVSQYTGVTKRGRRQGSEEPDTRASSLIGYKIAKRDDLVVNIMLAWNGSLGVTPHDGVVSPAYCVYRFRSGNPQFYHYLLRSALYRAEIKRRSRGIVESRLRLYSDDLFRIPLIEPPRDEQDAIVRYLNTIDQRIHRFIRNRRRLIKVLNEQKQAIINRAVTRGLDPDVKLKPSGVEWLGDIPEHWEVRRLKFLTKCMLQYGANEQSGQQDVSCPRYVRITDIKENGELREDTLCTIPNDIAKPYLLHEGDILFARSGATVGKTFCYQQNWGEAAYAGYLIRARIDFDKINYRFIFQFTRSQSYSNWIESNFIQATIQNISAEKYASLWIPLPPSEEQKSIVRFIEEESRLIDLAISRAQREIDLIREYRTRLIADVVTGKVDVRGIAVEQKKSAEVIQFPKGKDLDGRKANVHFRRAVFAAEIVARLHKEPTFGHVKFEKLIFLCEKKCGVDIGSTYYRQAAGPYDNRALRSIDSQMKKQKWYTAQMVEGRYRYTPLPKAGGHKTYFDRYFADIEKEFSNIIETFRKLDTERCEIVATLYSAWEDLLKDDPWVSDERIVREVLNNWHESKKRIPRERWKNALKWMRQNGFVPVISEKSRKADE